MRAIIQKTLGTLVEVDGKLISSIGRGLCVLVGISKDDTLEDVQYIARKILNIKLFEDSFGKKWETNVQEIGVEVLCVSQFTLYHTLRGNKLDFHNAMPAQQAEPLYNELLSILKSSYEPDQIKGGRFGADMIMHIRNDGPVTVQLDSRTSQ